MFTLEEKIACLAREIAMRKIVYPNRVKGGQMTKAEALYELGVMQAIHDEYRQQLPDLFREAALP